MIVRILGEGQFFLAAEHFERVNELDAEVEAAVESGDEERFRAALAGLLGGIRLLGHPHELESLDESDVILPPADASLEEVRDLLGDEGLVPG